MENQKSQSPVQKLHAVEERQIVVGQAPSRETKPTQANSSRSPLEAIIIGFPRDVTKMFEGNMDIKQYLQLIAFSLKDYRRIG